MERVVSLTELSPKVRFGILHDFPWLTGTALRGGQGVGGGNVGDLFPLSGEVESVAKRKRGQRPWEVRQISSITSKRECNRREAVHASDFKLVGMLNTIFWLERSLFEQATNNRIIIIEPKSNVAIGVFRH
jgi:hypothetical protein